MLRRALIRAGEPTRLPEISLPFRSQVRLDIALDEGRPAEILECFDRLEERRRRVRWGGYGVDYPLAVARAVARTHPTRALALYTQLAEETIAVAKPVAYEDAARHLRAMRLLYKRVGRPQAWAEHIEQLRTKHRRKWRLVEILDGLTGKPVVRRERRRSSPGSKS